MRAKLRIVLQAAVIIAACVWAYWPAMRGGWLWDDTMYIARNALLRSPDALRKIWFAPPDINYFPITTTLQWAQWRLWGDDTLGYHLTNLGLHLLSALRIFLPDTGFTLSTREPADFRDHLIPLGITSMSAGSRTDPGGYTHPAQKGAEAQFEIADHRDPETMAEVIRRKGYEAVWKDWDCVFLQ